jgi:hypothetical protein
MGKISKKNKILQSLWSSDGYFAGLTNEDIIYISSHLPDEDGVGAFSQIEDDSSAFDHSKKDYVSACGLKPKDLEEFIDTLKEFSTTEHEHAVSSIIQEISNYSKKSAKGNRVVALIAYRHLEASAVKDRMKDMLGDLGSLGGGGSPSEDILRIIKKLKDLNKDTQDGEEG